MVSLGSIIPYFLPIPLFMSHIYIWKSKKNFNNYLND